MASEAAFDPIFIAPTPVQQPGRGPVFGDFFHASSGRLLLLMVEPIATTSRARDNAAKVLEVAGSRFRGQPLMAPRDIVVDCCDNAVRGGERAAWPQLRAVGITAAIIDGARAVVARTAPGAVILVQDEKLFADPPFVEPTRRTEGDDDRSLLNINFQPGDVLMLCSSALHKSLWQSVAAREGGLESLGRGLSANVEDLIAGFEELAAADDLDATSGALIFKSTFDQAVIWQPVGREPALDTPVSRDSREEHHQAPLTPVKIVSIYPPRPRPVPAPVIEPIESMPEPALKAADLVESSRHERLHTFLLHAFESHVPKRRSTAFAFSGGTAPAVMPGASTVQLFRGAFGATAMTELRTLLPRGPRVRIPTKLISMVMAILILLASVAFFYQRSEGRAEAARQAITAADVQLASAENESNPVTLTAELALAEKALATAEANGASEKELKPRRQALANVKDQMANIVRLTNVTRVGMVPPDVSVLKPALIQLESNTYLVAGGLYHLDLESRTLDLVLRQDKKIAGGKVGNLKGGTVDRTGMTLTDGKSIFRTGTTGKWKRLKIWTFDNEPWDDARFCGAFSGNFYILNKSSGQILKFDAEELNVAQDPWASQQSTPELEHALDMVVRDKIYVLLEDGRLLGFFQGEKESTYNLNAEPGVNSPTVMFGGQDINFIYIADKGSGGGRILRVDDSGELSKQFLLPEHGQDGYVPGAEHAFSHIDDFVVDEATGQVVILSGDQLWSATIPTT